MSYIFTINFFKLGDFTLKSEFVGYLDKIEM